VTGHLSAKPWWLPVAAAVLAVGTAVTGSAVVQSIGFLVVAAAALPVGVAAVRRGDLSRRLAAGLVMLAVVAAFANLLRSLSIGHPRALRWAELMGLCAVAIIIGAVAVVARNRRSRDFWGILADGGIVALGAWLLAWVTIVRPTLERKEMDPWLTVVRGAFQPLSAVIVFLLIIVVFSDKARTPAIVFFSGAISLALASGLLRGLTFSGHSSVYARVSTTLSVIALGTLYASVMHPSVRTLTRPLPDGPERPVTGRILLTTAALVFPIIVMSATMPKDTTDRLVRSLSVGLLALLVTLRTAQTVRSNRSAQSTLLHSAQTDSLTGLPNRSLLLEQINATLHESWKSHEHPTLFFIDLDRFKNINDSLGHAAGDRVLCVIADRLRQTVPARATVARISGDEYVVFDPASPSLGDATELADMLLAQFREPLTLAAPAGDVFVTASIGVARLEPQSHRSADVLLGHADTAMYQAKEAGRNCVAMFDESMHERVTHRLSVETALYRALDRNELRLYYQPILEMATGEVTGFEALMRWQQADGTIVSPAEFIPIAEETGIIIKMGAWALLEAMNQMRSWIDDGVCSPTANMSVNVSPRQLADPAFPTVVNDVLLQSHVSPNLLWLEVTEGIMIAEPEVALATLRRLRSLGVRVAIDDFGTGYSSLSSLQQFPLQRIKIDRAFVQGVADNANDRSLVRTIIAMGASLGLDMVAEGVETVQQLQVLSELGCTKAQGYLISRPMPPDAMRSTVSALERVGAWPGTTKQRQQLQLIDEDLEASVDVTV
jgi:diguanylate cyclase (GGDEF)-like protein